MIEQVVLCDEAGQAVGVAAKVDVHHADTPLHLAFSCYLFDAADHLLVTRRAHGKLTFPGITTNTCCGHPSPGESMRTAVTRRLRQELGVVPAALDLVLPAFRYRAEMAGTVEHELCPVYRARVSSRPTLTLDPDEVDDAWWVPWDEFVVRAAEISPWAALQVRALARLGAPARWPVADPSDLPAAARP